MEQESRLTIKYINSQDLPLTETSTIKLFIRDQLHTLEYPFTTPLNFNLESLSSYDNLQIFLELTPEDLLSSDLPTSPGEHQVQFSSRENVLIGFISFSVQKTTELLQAKKNNFERSYMSDHECHKCSYMEKIYDCQMNQIMALEEYKNSLNDIKGCLQVYYSNDHIPFTSQYVPECEELCIELPQGFHGKLIPVTKQENESLKTNFLSLIEKLKVFHSTRDDVRILKQQMFDSISNRIKLKSVADEKIEGFGDNSGEMVNKRIDLIDQLSKAKQELVEKKHLSSLKDIEIEENNFEILMFNANLEQLKAELLNFNLTKAHINKLESELKQSTEKRNDLVREYNKFSEVFNQSKITHLENIQRLKLDKSELETELSSIQKEISEYKNENGQLLKTNSILESEIRNLQKEISELTEENKINEQARLLSSEKEDSIITLHLKISNASKDFTENLNKLSEANSSLLKEKLNVVEELNKLNNLLEAKSVKVQDLTRVNYSSVVQCTILEQQVYIKNDQLEKQKNIDLQQEVNEKIKNLLLNDISMMGEKLKQQSEDCNRISKDVEVYKKKLDEKNNYKKEVKRIICDLKGFKKVYTPFRGEQVDELLAEILNNRFDWIQIGVKRLGPGCYKFGNKNVTLSICSRKLVVKFGRAEMELEEFLQVYIPLETQKIKLLKKSSIN